MKEAIVVYYPVDAFFFEKNCSISKALDLNDCLNIDTKLGVYYWQLLAEFSSLSCNDQLVSQGIMAQRKIID